LRHGRAVLGRHTRTGRKEPPQSAVEVRPPRSRPSLDDDEAVRREDERRDLRAELFGCAKGCAVQSSLLRIAGAKSDLDLEPGAAPGAAQLDPRGLGAEANELSIVPAPRREALRPDVERLEQIRLARAVPADRQYEPRGQLQLERRVRAVVAKRDFVDDQPACGASPPSESA
jgi:hypothetical protein